MIRKVVAAVAVSLLVLNIVGAFIAMGQVENSRAASANPLVSMLPASDVVVVGDGKRFFTEAPKLLAANQKVLGELLSKLDLVQAKTGVDLRKFETFAAGASVTKSEAPGYKISPVVIARGSADSAVLIEAAKKAAEGKAKQETVAGRTMYVVSAKDAMELAKKHAPVSANSNKVEDKVAQVMDDLAIAAIDSNTVVFGYASRVRETLEAKSKVNDELLGLLAKKPIGIANFAAKVPGGMSSLLPLDNDDLGAMINSVKAVYGAADVANGQATVNLTAVTEKADQAEELKGTLDGLKVLGKSMLGASQGADKKLYAKLLDSVKLSNVGNELNLDLTIPQSDIDAIVAIFKK
jgi:hypothetical protein